MENTLKYLDSTMVEKLEVKGYSKESLIELEAREIKLYEKRFKGTAYTEEKYVGNRMKSLAKTRLADKRDFVTGILSLESKHIIVKINGEMTLKGLGFSKDFPKDNFKAKTGDKIRFLAYPDNLDKYPTIWFNELPEVIGSVDVSKIDDILLKGGFKDLDVVIVGSTKLENSLGDWRKFSEKNAGKTRIDKNTKVEYKVEAGRMPWSCGDIPFGSKIPEGNDYRCNALALIKSDDNTIMKSLVLKGDWLENADLSTGSVIKYKSTLATVAALKNVWITNEPVFDKEKQVITKDEILEQGKEFVRTIEELNKEDYKGLAIVTGNIANYSVKGSAVEVSFSDDSEGDGLNDIVDKNYIVDCPFVDGSMDVTFIGLISRDVNTNLYSFGNSVFTTFFDEIFAVPKAEEDLADETFESEDFASDDEDIESDEEIDIEDDLL